MRYFMANWLQSWPQVRKTGPPQKSDSPALSRQGVYLQWLREEDLNL
jgi:hypothetical protein